MTCPEIGQSAEKETQICGCLGVGVGEAWMCQGAESLLGVIRCSKTNSGDGGVMSILKTTEWHVL